MKTETKRHPQLCKRCGYKWESTKEVPLQCVYCKSYKWNKPKQPK